MPPGLDLSEADIQRCLENHSLQDADEHYPPEFFTTPPRQAAVLIPFIPTQQGWEILYIRRSTIEGDMHSGQVAFPGGGAHPEDTSPESTALREANEEIGLDPSCVRILGTMPQLRTISRYAVTPIVGVIPPGQAYQLDEREVARVFTIPLAYLAEPANLEARVRRVDNWPEFTVYYFRPYQGETLWGASARITINLLRILGIND